MEPEQNPAEQPTSKFDSLHKVTPLSKYFAMVLFVLLPFVGGYIGYVYAPDKIIEVETSSQREIRDGDVSDNNLAATTVDMVSYQIRYSQDKIELLRGPEVIQTIPWDTSYRSFYTDDESLLITNWDINFDGYLDLGILTNVGSGGANRFYHFYTFDPETYTLLNHYALKVHRLLHGLKSARITRE